MAGRTPALTARTLAALRATLANSSELADPFPFRFPEADGPCATICIIRQCTTSLPSEAFCSTESARCAEADGYSAGPACVSGLMERTERELEGA